MQPLIELRHITKTVVQWNHVKKNILDDITFCMYPGEIVGVVGRSGAGKSTLAHAIAHLTGVTQGEMYVQGQHMTGLQGKALRPLYQQIQMVFQSPQESFDPRRTLGYSIGESLRNQGIHKQERQQRVQQVLQQCGLDVGMAWKYPHEVSGGQCQRAAIARALIVSPAVLLCDEATSALDTITQQRLIALLQQLNASQGMACLFICHNLALAQQFCQRLLIMHEGKIVEDGKTEDVLRHPKNVYTKELLQAVL